MKRTLYWRGWRLLEEHERTDPEGQQLWEERLTRQFIDGNGIDEHLVMDVYKQDGTGIEKTLYYHENARGDTVAMSDASGNMMLRLAYSAYGEVYRINGNRQLEPFTDYESVVYCFQGRRFDQETGMYYYRNRYYDPVQGRFSSRDPLEYVDSMELYEFAKNNPLTFSDPLGQQQQNQPNGPNEGVKLASVLAYKYRVITLIYIIAEKGKEAGREWANNHPISDAIPGTPIETDSYGNIVHHPPYDTYPPLFQKLLEMQEYENSQFKTDTLTPNEIKYGTSPKDPRCVKEDYAELIGYYSLYIALSEITDQYTGQYIAQGSKLYDASSWDDSGIIVPSNVVDKAIEDKEAIRKQARQKTLGTYGLFHHTQGYPWH